MDYAALLPTYLYLFASQFIPRLSDEVATKDKFVDNSGHPVSKKELENTILAITLFELKKQGLLLLQGNGTVTFVKKPPTAEEILNSLSQLQSELLKAITTEPEKLTALVVSLKIDLMELVRADLIASGVLVNKAAKKLLVLPETKLLPNTGELTYLASHIPEAAEELEVLKKDSLFNEVLTQLKAAEAKS